LARPPERGSRPAIRHIASASAADAGKTSQAPPPVPKRAGFRLDRGTVLLVAALLACATLPYLNILVNGFVFDDDLQLVRNPYVRSFQHLKEIFTASVWSFRGVTVSNYYRPMMTLGYLLGYKIFGLRPYGFHLVSLSLHALVVCLVFALTKRLTGDRAGAFVASAWFALHPIHTESVAWIAAVVDLELTFFYLITFGLFLALARPGGKCSGRRVALMGATFVLALLSKEPAMTLPALATVYEHFYREDRTETSISQKLARYGLLWLLGAIYVLLRVHFLGALAPRKGFGQVTRLQIMLSAIALVGQYVWKLVWPVRLYAFYVFHPSTSPFDPRVLAGSAVLLGLAALFLVCWRSRERNVRFASFAILWFLATLAPVLNARWVGESVFTERYLYLPSVGVAWLVGLGATKLWSRAGARPAPRWALALVGVTVGMLYAARIVVRDRDWNNDIVFYTRTLEFAPVVPLLHVNLGRALAEQGRIDEAMAQYSKALRIDPDFPMAHFNLGAALAAQGRIDGAMAQYSEALRIDPDFPMAHMNVGVALVAQGRIDEAMAQYSEALRIEPDFPEAHFNLGLALARQGRIDEAMAQYSEALRIKPDYLQAHFNLGAALAAQGRIDEAIAQYSKALRIEPDSPMAHMNLGVALAAQGRIDEAMAQYSEALRLKPDFPEARNNLGLALATQGRIAEAIAQYSEALRLKPDFPEACFNLGLALASQGRIAEAMVQYSEALRLEPDFPEAHLNLGAALAAQGRIDEAMAHYTEALRLKPDYPEAHLNLGAALAAQGRIAEAMAHYTEALRLKPDYPEARFNLGQALAAQGRIAEAIAQYSEALRIKPGYPEAHMNLGTALAAQGRINEAMAQWSEALRLEPDYPEAHFNLGLALAGQGRIDEAMTQCSEALRFKPDYPQARRLLNNLMSRAKIKAKG
jgi:tetratricopeptide (TPR) repeat protein